jgi:hypothetical protein
MEPVKEAQVCTEQMAIMERYERVIAYLYPIVQSVPRNHGTVRDMVLRTLFGQADLFYQAGKSGQISRIHAADAGLAQLRFWMRFLLSIRCMTPHQLQAAQVLVAEVGGMIHAWAKKQRIAGQDGK